MFSFQIVFENLLSAKNNSQLKSKAFSPLNSSSCVERCVQLTSRKEHLKPLPGDGETAQKLRVLAAFTENPSSVPSTHIVVYNHL